jgi:hypothetical protein
MPWRCAQTILCRLAPFGNVAFPQRMLTGASGYHELIFDKGDHFIVWTERVRVREAILEKLRDAE